MRQGNNPGSCYDAVKAATVRPAHSLCNLALPKCSQQDGKSFLNLAQSYRWFLGTAWAQQLTSGLQLRPGYIPSQAKAAIEPSSSAFKGNAMVTPLCIPLEVHSSSAFVDSI